MAKEKTDFFQQWLNIMLGLLAIVAVRSIIENDNSKIISKKGRSLLSDEKKMKALNDKFIASEKGNDHGEIII
jgi:hypothetical protein